MDNLDSTVAAILGTLEEGVASFDDEACLSFANPCFHRMHPALSGFLGKGARWDMFLREAEGRGSIDGDTCRHLAVIEAELLVDPDQSHMVEATVRGGNTATIVLRGTPNGGFVLTQRENGGDKAEVDAARAAEQLLSKVLEACPACLTMARVGDGRILYKSPAATELLGTGISSFAHFARREDRADFITALLPDGRVDDMRVTGMDAEGVEFPAQISARLIDYLGEEVVVANMEDLSDALAMEAELDRQREQVFQSEKMSALGELLAGVAHELNNPLSIIAGNTEILGEELEHTEHSARIEKVNAAAERCVRIVRSFLSMARQDPLEISSVEVSALFENACQAVSNLLPGAGMRVETDIADKLPHLSVDELQIGQVLSNLLTNAIHAIDDSGTGDRITLKAHRPDKSANLIEIQVSDNGPGIDPAIRNRIFDPLFTTKKGSKGTGVGLAYCARVLASHGGLIRLEAGENGGATFTLHLPLAET